MFKSSKLLNIFCKEHLKLSSVLEVNWIANAQFNFVRYGSNYKLNKNMQLMTADDSKITRKGKSFQLDVASSEDRTLTLMLPWLHSQPKHVDKYIKLYHDHGIDVLKTTLLPNELLRPKLRAKAVAGNILEFLQENPRYSRVVVHGFSVGAFLFCGVKIKMDSDMEQYGPLMDRFVGQIWDSAVDVSGLPVGVARSITDNPTLHRMLWSCLEFFLWAAPQRKSYEAGSRAFHGGVLRCPSLFFGSRADVISPPPMITAAVDNFKKQGITVFRKEFEKSGHVAHYSIYKEEYEEALFKYLKFINVINETKN